MLRGPLCDLVRGQDCCVPRCKAQGEPHHVLKTGLGFLDWLKGWIGNVIPLCRFHHDEFHAIHLINFDSKYAICCQAIGARWGLELMEGRTPHFAILRAKNPDWDVPGPRDWSSLSPETQNELLAHEHRKNRRFGPAPKWNDK